MTPPVEIEFIVRYKQGPIDEMCQACKREADLRVKMGELQFKICTNCAIELDEKLDDAIEEI